MKQSRMMSLLESGINIAVGFGLSLGAQVFFLPLLGVTISLSQNVTFALIMTAISIARSYLLRRLFEALHIRTPISPAMAAVIAERRRQIEVEGWDSAHDDAHGVGEMAQAGACYALMPSARSGADPSASMTSAKALWPWFPHWWKPRDDRRDMVRSAALIVAEIEKHDRSRKRRA